MKRIGAIRPWSARCASDLERLEDAWVSSAGAKGKPSVSRVVSRLIFIWRQAEHHRPALPRLASARLGEPRGVSIAEVDQAAAMNITAVDIVEDASVHDKKADGQEAIDLDGGKQKTIVLRY